MMKFVFIDADSCDSVCNETWKTANCIFPGIPHILDKVAAHIGEIQSTYEPHHEKTNVLHMRKQRRRSTSR